jgi:hypothetical protein
MGDHGKAAGLVAHLGSALGIVLALDEGGGAGFVCADGTVVVLAASPDGAVLVLEAQPPEPVWPEGAAMLRAALALNRAPALGFAALAADRMERSLVLRQPLATGGVDPAGFVSLVSRFVAAAGHAFGQLRGRADTPEPAAPAAAPSDFITLRL